MFLRAKIRKKDGKQHRYFSVVENRRVGQKRTAQRTSLAFKIPRAYMWLPEDRVYQQAIGRWWPRYHGR